MADTAHGRVRFLDDGKRLGVTIYETEYVEPVGKWRELAARIMEVATAGKFGCHCDLESMDDSFEPDGCVIDEGRLQDCIFSNCGDKWKCEYWRPIKELSRG